ncbi:MAG: hypothetical protein NC395_05250 [Prevotella sp.]|nr:hypothetical protein [Prevotella sp.]
MGILDMFSGAGNGLIDLITPTKKPGEYCPVDCRINDIRCEACLAEQDKIRAALDELQNLEYAFEDARSSPREAEPRITKCTLCGAPIEDGEQNCPYCGEAYPAGTAAIDIPSSEAERDNILLQKASEIYNMYAALRKRGYENMNSDMKGKLPGFLGGAAGSVYFAASKFVDMSPQEIRQQSRQNGVGYRDYVMGVLQGVYKSSGDIRLQQLSDLSAQGRDIAMENSARMRAENERYRAEIRQIDQQKNQQINRLRQERLEMKKKADLDRIKSTNYYGGGSGGGSSKCCGTCKYYGAGKCCAMGGKWEGLSKNASEYCGWYDWKN